MKEDCVLYKATKNEMTGAVMKQSCALNDDARIEMERENKCGTYECPFYKESWDEER